MFSLRFVVLALLSLGFPVSAAPLDERAAEPTIVEPIESEPIVPCLPIGGPGHVAPLTDRELSSRHTCPRPLVARQDYAEEGYKYIEGFNGSAGYNSSESYYDKTGEDGHVFDPSIIAHLGPGPVVLGPDLKPVKTESKRDICNVNDLDC
ncbi:hypothetical protein PENSPDRAFT_681636 [Peniophora sp. CONT]|nr:hypothetical protein PENSPDRAFT_681636 [Peniophora sp. CONT]